MQLEFNYLIEGNMITILLTNKYHVFPYSLLNISMIYLITLVILSKSIIVLMWTLDG